MNVRVPLHGESGLSLVEILVAVAIIGIAFVAILGGMSTGVLVSDLHRKQATGGTVLREYAEAIEAAPYEACGSSEPVYSLAADGSFSPPAGFTATVGAFQVWTGDTPATFVDCPATDRGLQRMRLTVTSADGRASETVEILKRRE